MFQVLQDFTAFTKGWSYVLAAVILTVYIPFLLFLSRRDD
jgi:hypothetical protein